MTAVATNRTIRPHDATRIRFGGVVRSEWIKLRSLRSTIWSFALLIVLPIGIGLLLASLAGGGGDQAVTGRAAQDALVQYATAGTVISVLVVAVIGALVVTGEYGTGMIRSTFTAVPQRATALAAKALVLAVTTFVASGISVWVTALVALPIASGRGVDASLADWQVVAPMLGASVYITLIGLFAFAVGVMLRTTAGAIATVLGMMLVAPLVVQLVQGFTNADWLGTVLNVLPQNAGQHLMTFGTTSSAGWHDGVLALDGWSGFAVLLGWVVAASAAALTLVEKRDA